MKFLPLPGAMRVAYLGERALLSIDYHQCAYLTRLWDLSGDAPPRVIPSEQAGLTQALFMPGGEPFLRRHGLWPEGDELPAAAGDDEQVRRLFEPRANRMVEACGPDGTPVVYSEARSVGRTHTARFLLRHPGGKFRPLYEASFEARLRGSPAAAFSPDGRLVAMSGGDRVVAVWDVAGRKELCRLEQGDQTSELAFTSAEYLAVAAGRTVRFWDVKERRVRFKSPAFRKVVNALAVSSDRHLLAAASQDGSVRLWEAETGRQVANHDWDIGAVKAVAFAPSGATAAAAGARGIVIWDLD
jgi:WD40 repeat protein